MEKDKKQMLETYKETDLRLNISEEEFIKNGPDKKKIIEGIEKRAEKIVKEAEVRWEEFEKKLEEIKKE